MKEVKSRVFSFALIAGTVTILLVTPVLVLLFIGFFADKFFHTGNLFLMLGGVMGFVGGMMNVYKLVKKLS